MIHEAWFKFKGIDSRQMGMRVTAMPKTTRPEKRVETLTVAGRNGSLHLDEGVYESYDKTMECAVIKRAKIDELAAWLIGSGEMIFSTEPDKVYEVMMSNKIEFSAMMRTFQKFMVTMDTQPFKYSVNAFGDTLELTKETKVLNPGTVYSQPSITVHGSGDIILRINNVDYPLHSVEDHITIDCEMMEVFKGDTSQNSRYGAMDFPRLEPGENTISWSGNVEKIVIEPKWRWL